ncbi:acyl-CoA dehydrogenase family protein [Microbacterium sp. zg.Y909]|uniref:acyl-CoA dehydrogenase family protein n=1 Tax=Microbacterium sp. zg.Y909 TaxID=2969413 RepID=UPI00214BC688|nr:acyl-CoA dehydrogenase [Microbacterium sp. zg.Y909]MCR2824079.1 acyl-CoA dehydrogenase [Microbacterium sp. zg.Y909]
MDLSLSEEQRTLRELVDDILAEHAPPEKVSEILSGADGYPRAAQEALHEAGMTTIGLEDDEDATLVELGIILTELGYFAYTGPFLASAIAGVIARRALGEAGAGLVDAVRDGAVATLADLSSIRRSGSAVSGRAGGVEWADGAEHILLAAPHRDGVGLWIVTPQTTGVRIVAQRMMDGTRAGAVILENAELGEPLAELTGAQWRENQHLMRLLRAADLVGVIRRVQEMTTAHVLQREQFGKPIGQFQAVQHHLANMAIDQEAARNLVNHALWRYAEGEPFERQAAEAGWFLGDAAVRATQTANQLHGGIGFMKEYHLHHFHNRSATQRGRMGPEGVRLAQLGDVVVEALDRGFQEEFVDWPVR